jgi:hypothetical protein
MKTTRVAFNREFLNRVCWSNFPLNKKFISHTSDSTYEIITCFSHIFLKFFFFTNFFKKYNKFSTWILKIIFENKKRKISDFSLLCFPPNQINKRENLLNWENCFIQRFAFSRIFKLLFFILSLSKKIKIWEN